MWSLWVSLIRKCLCLKVWLGCIGVVMKWSWCCSVFMVWCGRMKYSFRRITILRRRRSVAIIEWLVRIWVCFFFNKIMLVVVWCFGIWKVCICDIWLRCIGRIFIWRAGTSFCIYRTSLGKSCGKFLVIVIFILRICISLLRLKMKCISLNWWIVCFILLFIKMDIICIRIYLFVGLSLVRCIDMNVVVLCMVCFEWEVLCRMMCIYFVFWIKL